MDSTLSEFLAKTSCEPGFAQDLLNHHNWNLAEALKSYYQINDIIFSNGLRSANNGAGEPRLPPSQQEKTIENGALTHKEIFLVPNKCTSEPSLSSQSSDACDSSVLSSPTKSSLKFRCDDLFPDKKLSRGISRASDNENLISKARSDVAQDFQTSSRGSRLMNLDKLLETPDFTFTLPDIYVHQEEFCDFLKRDLIEKSTLNSLETEKRLNWWSEICENLYPLVTSGDGNCLLHAASLGMWGFHDRELILRKALHVLLSNSSYTRAFYRRWRWQTHFQNSKAGLSYSESEWEKEWENIVRIASTEPRAKNSDSSFEMNGGKKEPNDDCEERAYIYESLEEIHIFVLAHVLRRPIIVIADTMLKDTKGEAFYPILFGGIYLPLECPDDCLMKSPLCLTYDAAHFSALVAMNKEKISNEKPLAIPLMDVEHNILPLHFSIDPGEEVFAQENTSVDKVFENMAKTYILTEQDKIELLKKYFDLLTLAHKKDNCIEKEIKTVSTPPLPPKVIEKSQTLPSDFGRKSDFPYAQISDEKYRYKTFLSRTAAKQLLQKPFVSFGRMGKRIKKNLHHLARRSTSFRAVKTNAPTAAESKCQNDETAAKQNQNDFVDFLVVDNRQNQNETATLTPDDLNLKESIINTDNSIFYCDTNVLAAKLYTNKRHLYYDDMIKNYLSTARMRFSKEKEEKLAKKLAEEKAAQVNQQQKQSSAISLASTTTTASSSSSSSSLSSVHSAGSGDGTTAPVSNATNTDQICVNQDCTSAASMATNYLCPSCFAEQKKLFSMGGYASKKTPPPVPMANNDDDKSGNRLPQEDSVQKKLQEINGVEETNRAPSSNATGQNQPPPPARVCITNM